MPIRKSSISGGSGVPSGSSDDRPATPAIGDQFYNGTLGVLELYTPSGWLPATGANDFNVVLAGATTSVTLDKEYFSGAYTITSSLSDTTFDIYLFDTQNNFVGYTSNPSINATGNFNKIVVYGGTVGDLLSFSYKTTFTTSNSTADTFAAPYILSVDPTDLPNLDDTVTITGGNFDTDVEVWFDGQNSYSQQAKSVVYGSSTSIVATRPDSLLEDNAPYSLRVIKPQLQQPESSSSHTIGNITAGQDPLWSTAAGSLLVDVSASNPVSVFLAATDDAGSSISYNLVSGSLPNGISLNSNTGEIFGTFADVEGTYNFTISASDPSGNISENRDFSMSFGDPVSGGAFVDSGGYRYRTFTSNGTLTINYPPASLEVLLVAGGGGGGETIGGGAGAGGVLFENISEPSAGSYSVTVGGGGSAGSGSGYPSGGNGTDSVIIGVSNTAFGGGAGGGYNNTPGNGGSGGGDGGASALVVAGQGTPGQGNDGGANAVSNNFGAGGGGAGAPGASSGSNFAGNGGIGTSAYSAWSIATSTGEVEGGLGYFGGGGGGGARNETGGAIGIGGPGGGGNGGKSTAGDAGLSNTGGGGGGGGYISDLAGGAGGSGVVIVRYAI